MDSKKELKKDPMEKIEVDIRLTDRKPEGFPSGIAAMPLGDYVIAKSWQTLKIERHLLESKQCKEWMFVTKPGQGNEFKLPPIPKKDMSDKEKSAKLREEKLKRDKQEREAVKAAQKKAEDERKKKEESGKGSEKKAG